jgi:transcriptional regulator with XRE-family HTH domain/quercetin dioxygenase-like cupin family protein
MAADMPEVGLRIRAERLRREMSLRALAREVGVSASMISQIETGRARPSVGTLYAITTALGMSLQDAFDGPPVADRPAPAPAGVLALLGASRQLRLGPVVRPGERHVLTLDSGVTWERLGALPGHRVDFLRATYAPGGSSSPGDALMRHPGCEYGYLLAGELVLTLGFEETTLRPGDAVTFDSTTPHRYRNDGTEPAVGIWYVLDS